MAVPALGLGWAAWETWGGLLQWQDLVVFAITYLLTGIGITVRLSLVRSVLQIHASYCLRSFHTAA